jgi:hypothetical protein
VIHDPTLAHKKMKMAACRCIRFRFPFPLMGKGRIGVFQKPIKAITPTFVLHPSRGKDQRSPPVIRQALARS